MGIGAGGGKHGTSWLKPGKGQISSKKFFFSVAEEPTGRFLIAAVMTGHSLDRC